MKMDDNELKRILQEGMEYEADRIMAQVESDPSMKDVVAPEEVYIKLKQQIHEHQEEEERDRQSQAKEDEELIRLGKIYKKKRSRRKYYVLLVAVLCALGVGTVSFGDGKKVFTKITRMLESKQRTVINAGDEDSAFAKDIADEAEAFEQIEEAFGFVPVKMVYLPEGMEFAEQQINKELQLIQLHYRNGNEKSISYRILIDYRAVSLGVDIEDIFIGEYEKKLEEANVVIKEYQIKENKSSRWLVSFVHKDAQYTMILTGIDKQEVEKILDNLIF